MKHLFYSPNKHSVFYLLQVYLTKLTGGYTCIFPREIRCAFTRTKVAFTFFHIDLGEKESIIGFQMKYSNDNTINSSNIIMHILTLNLSQKNVSPVLLENS